MLLIKQGNLRLSLDSNKSYTQASSHCYLSFSGDVQFSLNFTTYQNNSIVTLEDIGEVDDALLCITNLTTCCLSEFFGRWSFPNGTVVPSSGDQWDFYRTRDPMVVLMHRRRGGVEGIYYCEISDSMNVTQIMMYIGVYNTSTGK